MIPWFTPQCPHPPIQKIEGSNINQINIGYFEINIYFECTGIQITIKENNWLTLHRALWKAFPSFRRKLRYAGVL